MQVMNNIHFDVIAIFYALSYPPYSVTTQFVFLEFVKDEATAAEAKLKLHLFPVDIISSAAMGKKTQSCYAGYFCLAGFFSVSVFFFKFCSLDFPCLS